MEIIEELEWEATADPGGLLSRGGEVLAEAVSDADRVERLRLLGLAARINRDLDGSRRYLEQAAALAREIEAPSLGRVLVTLAATQAYLGDNPEALHSLAEAEPLVDGFDRAVLGFQRAGVLQRMGRREAALAEYRLVIPDLRRSDDPTWEADARMNRSILFADAGQVADARRDVEVALTAYETVGSASGVADALHNLGFVALRSGDIPAALGYFDDAEAAYDRAGIDEAAVPPARSEALISAGLFRRAFDEATAAAEQYREAGSSVDEAEALLLATRAANLSGAPRRAFDLGHRSATMFAEQDRPGWSAIARFEVLFAKYHLGGDDASAHAETALLAEELHRAGHRSLCGRAHLLSARFSSRACDLVAAERHLDDAWRLLRRGPIEHRIEYWATCAGHRDAAGNPRGVSTAISAGLRCFERHQDSFAALDLRTHVGEHVRTLGELLLRRTASSGSAVALSRAIEQTRSRALLVSDVRPPVDAGLARLLDRVRAATAVVRRAEEDGTVGPQHLAAQRNAQRDVEQFLARQRGRASSARSVEVTSDDECFVQIGVVDHELVAVRTVRGRRRRLTIGSLDEAMVAALDLQRSLDVVAAGGTDTVDDAAERLDRLVGPAFHGLDSGSGVMICPPPELFDVAWGSLPSLASRCFEVSPSIAMWRQARQRPRPRDPSVAIATGPGLDGAVEEVVVVQRCWHDATAHLDADVETVVSALDGANIGHLIAHGSFEAENPLFSALEFADGPLVFHDLQRIEKMPAIMVLSSCSGALHSVRGRSVIGFGAGLLSLGAKSVICAPGFVPDHISTATVVGHLHPLLADGVSPATALARIRADLQGRLARVASLFTAYGGW